jgi:hypothetical protein
MKNNIDKFKKIVYNRGCANIEMLTSFKLGSLAQVVEHLTFNQVVRGSSPRWLTKLGSRLLTLRS